jgi:broad specificity phosphatase PhoE
MEKYILLIRHPESTKNILDKMGTSSSFQLSKKGIEQAHLISEVIAERFSKYSSSKLLFVSSNELRSQVAANIISAKLKRENLELNFEPIKIGLLNGLTKEDAKQKFPNIMSREEKYFKSEIDGYSLSYPKGESTKEFQSRIINLLKQVLEKGSYTYFIFVLHQSVIATIINYFKYIHLEIPLYPFNKIDLCSFSEIIISENKSVVSYINKQLI